MKPPINWPWVAAWMIILAVCWAFWALMIKLGIAAQIAAAWLVMILIFLNTENF